MFLGRAGGAPGRRPLALNPQAVSAISSSITQPARSSANGNLRGSEAVGLSSVAAGADWSGATSVHGYSGQGIVNAHTYCFAAGTLVLLADGATKPIEQIQAGDLVLSADGARQPGPSPRRVVQTYHNAPAAT